MSFYTSMHIPLLSLLLTSVITFIAINFLRPLAVKINLIDLPSIRKPHTGSIPLIGGIAMFLGIIITILTSSYDLNQFSYFMLASLIIILVGVLDDHQNISVSIRLLFQILVALIIVSGSGISIMSVGNITGGGELALNQWTQLFTLVAIISGMNAVNMSDGIHGLAGGNSLITFLAILYLSIDSTYQASLLIVFLFCSALPVFLIHNLCIGMSSKKRIFMGDAGSMFIGLSIAWVLIDLSQGEGRSFSPVTALWLFAIPLIEITTAVLRRLMSGSSPFKPDLFHTHHLLIKLGIKEKYTLLLVLSASFLMAIVGILGELFLVSERIMFLSFLLIFGIYNITSGLALKKIKYNKD